MKQYPLIITDPQPKNVSKTVYCSAGWLSLHQQIITSASSQLAGQISDF
jgi:hypothetical protein